MNWKYEFLLFLRSIKQFLPTCLLSGTFLWFTFLMQCDLYSLGLFDSITWSMEEASSWNMTESRFVSISPLSLQLFNFGVSKFFWKFLTLWYVRLSVWLHCRKNNFLLDQRKNNFLLLKILRLGFWKCEFYFISKSQLKQKIISHLPHRALVLVRYKTIRFMSQDI